MLEGWEDEEESLKMPENYRCHRCKKIKKRVECKFIVIEHNGLTEGYFLCFDCIDELKPKECPFVIYNDANGRNFICKNCPIPYIVCNLRDDRWFSK